MYKSKDKDKWARYLSSKKMRNRHIFDVWLAGIVYDVLPDKFSITKINKVINFDLCKKIEQFYYDYRFYHFNGTGMKVIAADTREIFMSILYEWSEELGKEILRNFYGNTAKNKKVVKDMIRKNHNVIEVKKRINKKIERVLMEMKEQE